MCSMKKTSFFILITSLVFTFSCSNDFDVATDWKDIPVVYGLLNADDAAHYIRVEKAFLDPKANGLELARIPDSLYYKNVTVQLERISNGQVFPLVKVDGNLEGLPREGGVFAEAPNWLYKVNNFDIDLKKGEKILLRIQRDDGLDDVTAQTTILGPSKLKSPSPIGGVFRFDYNRPTKITWEADAAAKIYDVKLLIQYSEFDPQHPDDVQKKTLVWNWAQGIRNQENRSNLTLDKSGIEFYQLLKNNIPVNPNLKRIFEGIDVVINSGGESLEKFVNVSLANTGITGSQELPSYTNLSEGRGVFSSVSNLVVEKLLLHPITWDSLQHGYLTKSLNFF